MAIFLAGVATVAVSSGVSLFAVLENLQVCARNYHWADTP
jgi:hypothetical protein